MKIFIKFGAFLAAIVVTNALFSEEVVAEEVSPISMWSSVCVDFNSKYMWRGTIMNDNPAWQPSASLGFTSEEYGGIYATVWTSMDLTHRENTYGGVSRRNCGMQELDFYLAYTKSFGDLNFELGHWWYTYPNDNYKPYNDLVLTTSYTTGYVTPGVEVWWSYLDQDQMHNCFWFNFFLTRDFEFFDGALVFSPRVSMGFGDANHTKNYVTDYRGIGSDGNGAQITDQTTQLKLTYNITENIYISGHVDYSWVPSKTLRNERWMEYGMGTCYQVVYGGVSVGVNF